MFRATLNDRNVGTAVTYVTALILCSHCHFQSQPYLTDHHKFLSYCSITTAIAILAIAISCFFTRVMM